MSAKWEDRGVWVTGLMRSGTTLLLSLLDGHPELLVYPDEPSFPRLFTRAYQSSEQLVADWFYGTPNPLHLGAVLERTGNYPAGFSRKGEISFPADFKIHRSVKAALSGQVRIRGLGDHVEKKVIDLGLYHSELETRLMSKEGISARSVVIETMKALKKATGNNFPISRWLFKQPMSRFSSSHLHWFFENFEEGKCIVIVRDPRGQYSSLKTYMRWEKKDLSALRSLSSFVWRVDKMENDYMEICKLRSEYEHDRVKVIYYEDVLEDVYSVMQDLANFLEIRFDPVLTTPTKLGCPTSVTTARAGYGSVVSPELATAWETDLSDFEIASIEGKLRKFYKNEKNRYRLSTTCVRCYLSIFHLIRYLLSFRSYIVGATHILRRYLSN